MTESQELTMTPAASPAWMSLTEAATLLERSTKHVIRLERARLVASKLEQRPGRKPERLYALADLERCKAQETPAPVLHKVAEPTGGLPIFREAAAAAATAAAEAASPGTIVEGLREWLPELFRMWAQATQSTQKPLQATDHQWLTISEASSYTKASQARLLKACQSGRLTAIKDPAWKIRQSVLASWNGEV